MRNLTLYYTPSYNRLKRLINQNLKGKPVAGRLLMLKRLFCFAVFMLTGVIACFGQKYTFSQYGISEGLVQSQVNTISQDNDHSLWVGTYGGLSHFDGSQYTSYTRANGLPNDFIYTIFTDKDNVKWLGTENGIAAIIDGKALVYKLPPHNTRSSVTDIKQDDDGTIWFLMGNQLYKIEEQKVRRVVIQDKLNEQISCLATDKKGKLCAWVYPKGLYTLNGDKWSQAIPFTNVTIVIRKMIFENDGGRLCLMSDKNIYYADKGRMNVYNQELTKNISTRLLTMERDADGNLWLGTNNGAYCIRNNQLIHFDVNNGFTDKAVAAIYCDADKNLWFATQGNGVYKYEGDSFVTYSKLQGLTDDYIIFSVVKDNKGNIILGLDGGGLIRFRNGKFSAIPMPADKPLLRRIQSLYTDSKGDILAGTELNGVWRYHSDSFKLIEGSGRISINGLAEDADGNICMATPVGCFYSGADDKLKHIEGSAAFGFSVLPVGKDSLFIGTHDGLALAVNKKIAKGFKLDAVKNLAVICLIKYGPYLILGTDDNGVYIWNRTTGKLKNFNMLNGLNSNAVYSLVTDENGTVWAGTGRGVNKLLYDRQRDRFDLSLSKNSQEPIFESAQNGTLYYNHKIYLATDKGMIVYNTAPAPPPAARPNVVIRSVKLLTANADNSGSTVTMLKDGAELSHSSNHLNIAFNGIYLKDPGSIYYKYKLESLDSSFSAPVKNNTLDYPAIPPGKYTFRVKAYTAEGLESKNTAAFSFTIAAPFYQTWLFRAAGVLFLIILGVLIQAYRHSLKNKRIAAIENIRREENVKVRQEAAEDFHDDLGNKLTRISVLSDMLFTKLDPEKADQKKLLEQIKQNALLLYTGTKDILWAMDSQSDNLYEVINYIRDFGVDLYIDTHVNFELIGLEQSLSQVKLPIKFNRNIILIFKELLNNALKHANATQVTMDLTMQKKNELTIVLTDDGKGFDLNTRRKGQGVNNIVTRARRIGGMVDIKSAEGAGTAITLMFKLNNVS